MKINLTDIEFKISPWGELAGVDQTQFDFKISLFWKGQDIGYGLFFHQNSSIYCQEVDIYGKFQRQGVGTKLYNLAENISGKRIRPTGNPETGLNESGEAALSDQAMTFWKKRLNLK